MQPLTKRQREILDYLNEFIEEHGYAPSLDEISRHFDLNSISTIHNHLVNLEDKSLIKRYWNRARAIELLPVQEKPEARDVPLAGLIAAGEPIEAVRGNELVAVPEDMIGRREVYVLKVRGESMVDEQVRDGDYVIVENRTDPKNGEMVVALMKGEKATKGIPDEQSLTTHFDPIMAKQPRKSINRSATLSAGSGNLHPLPNFVQVRNSF